MKKIIIGLVLLLQSCVSNSTIESIKVGQKYECGEENPFEKDTIEIIAIKEGYAQLSSCKYDTLYTETLGNIGLLIEYEDLKLITKKTFKSE